MMLAAFKSEVLRELHSHFNRGERGSIEGLLLAVALGMMLISAWSVWRWAVRRDKQVSGRKLLGDAAREIGITRGQRRLLWRLGRAAGVEPAVGLLSPQLLTEMVERAEAQGASLSGRQMLAVGQMLDCLVVAINGKGSEA